MSSVSRDCLGYLQDALDEHTPPLSPPETWGTEWDADVWELGPPCPPDAVPNWMKTTSRTPRSGGRRPGRTATPGSPNDGATPRARRSVAASEDSPHAGVMACAHFRAAGALGFNATVARHWQGDRAGYAAWLRQNARLAAVEAAADILFRNGATCVEFDDDLPELPF